MGLIKQIDDQMGVLFDHLKQTGQIDDTLIVITSDHGDYLGDHWLGEKDLFHAQSVKVPLIIYDPSEAANATRGTVCDALVEGIDLAASFIDMQTGSVPDEVVEGRSLLPFLRGETVESWRSFAVSEYDYSMSPMANKLKVSAKDARLYMIADTKFKMMHSEGGMPPMLFDLQEDPLELDDKGRDPDYQHVIDAYYEKLHEWAMRCSQRTTYSDEALVSMRGASRRKGIVLGLLDEQDAEADILNAYRGKARQRHI